MMAKKIIKLDQVLYTDFILLHPNKWKQSAGGRRDAFRCWATAVDRYGSTSAAALSQNVSLSHSVCPHAPANYVHQNTTFRQHELSLVYTYAAPVKLDLHF
jgi:hypothetical protein